jgi:hypothetical protein
MQAMNASRQPLLITARKLVVPTVATLILMSLGFGGAHHRQLVYAAPPFTVPSLFSAAPISIPSAACQQSVITDHSSIAMAIVAREDSVRQ